MLKGVGVEWLVVNPADDLARAIEHVNDVELWILLRRHTCAQAEKIAAVLGVFQAMV